MQIAERLFNILMRPENKRSQLELAAYLGISDKTVGAWKSRNSDPPAKHIPAIAEFLGVSIDWLLTGEDKPPPNTVNGGVNGSAFVQGVNSGNVVVYNGGEHAISEEAAELLRVYEALDVKRRMQLLGSAFSLEAECEQGRNKAVELTENGKERD